VKTLVELTDCVDAEESEMMMGMNQEELGDEDPELPEGMSGPVMRRMKKQRNSYTKQCGRSRPS
jgi:hypothetical protein